MTAAVPLGGYKGYGLAIMVEVLSGVLTGAGVGHGIGALYGDAAAAQDVGHVHVAIDPGPLVGAAPSPAARGAAGRAVGERAGTGLRGGARAGEPEDRAARERSEHGIPLPPFVWNALRKAGEAMGVAAPDAR